MTGSAESFTLAGVAELATVVGALGVVAAIYASVRRKLRASVFSRQDLRRKLNKMACGVTADYVDGLFGPPPFVFSGLADKVADWTGASRTSYRIYRTRHAWLQVIAGLDGSVRAFSITVTDPRFKFRTGHLMFDQLDIRLGATRLGSVDRTPDGWLSRTGARTFGYAESHYFGNPGSYQVYVLGYNQVGAGHYGMPAPFSVPDVANPPRVSGGRLCPETGSRPEWEPLPAWLQPARDRTTANTLTVLAPVGDVALIQGQPGVDGDQVRLLREAVETPAMRRRRRMMRKEMRRMIAHEADAASEPDPAPELGDA